MRVASLSTKPFPCHHQRLISIFISFGLGRNLSFYVYIYLSIYLSSICLTIHISIYYIYLSPQSLLPSLINPYIKFLKATRLKVAKKKIRDFVEKSGNHRLDKWLWEDLFNRRSYSIDYFVRISCLEELQQAWNRKAVYIVEHLHNPPLSSIRLSLSIIIIAFCITVALNKANWLSSMTFPLTFTFNSSRTRQDILTGVRCKNHCLAIIFAKQREREREINR